MESGAVGRPGHTALKHVVLDWGSEIGSATTQSKPYLNTLFISRQNALSVIRIPLSGNISCRTLYEKEFCTETYIKKVTTLSYLYLKNYFVSQAIQDSGESRLA